MSDLNLLKQILVATRPEWDRPSTRSAVRKAFAAVLDCGTDLRHTRTFAAVHALEHARDFKLDVGRRGQWR